MDGLAWCLQMHFSLCALHVPLVRGFVCPVCKRDDLGHSVWFHSYKRQRPSAAKTLTGHQETWILIQPSYWWALRLSSSFNSLCASVFPPIFFFLQRLWTYTVFCHMEMCNAICDGICLAQSKPWVLRGSFYASAYSNIHHCTCLLSCAGVWVSICTSWLPICSFWRVYLPHVHTQQGEVERKELLNAKRICNKSHWFYKLQLVLNLFPFFILGALQQNPILNTFYFPFPLPPPPTPQKSVNILFGFLTSLHNSCLTSWLVWVT